MTKSRLEAFSDAVIAIAITIMVLDLKVPQGTSFEALRPLVPVFFCYVLSFVFLGIYWNNHHHLLHAVHRVSGAMLWPNLHLMFWLSLVPFVTAWMGENGFAAAPMALYGIVLFMASVAWTILQRMVVRNEGPDSLIARAYRHNSQGLFSPILYALGIGTAFLSPWIAGACYVGVALMWLVPDRRIEHEIVAEERNP